MDTEHHSVKLLDVGNNGDLIKDKENIIGKLDALEFFGGKDVKGDTRVKQLSLLEEGGRFGKLNIYFMIFSLKGEVCWVNIIDSLGKTFPNVPGNFSSLKKAVGYVLENSDAFLKAVRQGNL